MRPDPIPLLRQLRLAFAEGDLWKKLPLDVQAKCQEHLSQLMATIVIHEHRERRRDNERQDSL
jgi:hypothetical protein